MKRVACVFGLSGIAWLLTVGCSTTPAPSTPSPSPSPSPTPSPTPAPAPTAATISIAIPAAPLHVGETIRFGIRVNGTDPVFTLSVDFGDGISLALGPVSSPVDVSHVYRAAGTYTVTAAVTAINRSMLAVVPVRVEP